MALAATLVAPPVAWSATGAAAVASPTAAPELSFGSVLRLDDLVGAVLAHNSTLAEMQASVRAATARAERSTLIRRRERTGTPSTGEVFTATVE